MIEEEERAHAVLSPSGADRWMTCLGSTLLSIDEPDRTSEYAEEGTDYHTLAAVCLDTDTDAADYIGRPMESGNRVVTEANAKYLQEGYIDYVRQYAAGGSLQVEAKYPIAFLTGEPGAKGTTDMAVVRPDTELIIGDLKFGMGVEVSPEKNRQAMIYAISVIEKNELWTLVKTVRIIIFQPRIGDGKPKEWIVSIEALREFAKDVSATAKKIMSVDPATGDLLFVPNLPLTPSEKACKFCKANGTCPALRGHVDERMAEGFENLDERTDASLGGMSLSRAEVLGRAMDGIDLIEIYMKGVQQAVELELLAGKPVLGRDGHYKLVQGKKGNRKWTSEKEAEELFNQFRLKKNEKYHMKLISPTDAEKLLAESNPRCWVKCEKIITQSEGGKHVANALDKRPAIAVATPDEGFEEVVDVDEFI